jgi:cell division protein FtsW (lipid II flippase)
LHFLRFILGPDLRLRNAGWLCIAAALLISLLSVYLIDVAMFLAPPEGRLPVHLSGQSAKQLVFLFIGLLAAAVIALPHYRFVRFFAWPLMWVMVGFLIFLLLPFVPSSIVAPRNGARAWINFGFTDFQPAEIAKIAFVLVVADYLRFRQNHRTLLGLIPPGLIAAVPIGLIMLQPDLGTAMLFVPALFAMLLAAGARIQHLAAVVLIAILAAPVAYPLLKPHQKARIVGMINMMGDPTKGADDINYQSLTAQTLAGAGQLTGVPDARARVLIRYNRLPERHNDMILAVLMTRFGMLGALGLLFLYAVWFAGAYLSAALCKDAFARLTVVGCCAIMGTQIFINMAMTLGILPIIGITLPFVSYGGSSMLTVWIMTGLVMNIAMRPQVRLARPTFEFDARPYDPVAQHTPQRIAPMVGGVGGTGRARG